MTRSPEISSELNGGVLREERDVLYKNYSLQSNLKVNKIVLSTGVLKLEIRFFLVFRFNPLPPRPLVPARIERIKQINTHAQSTRTCTRAKERAWFARYMQHVLVLFPWLTGVALFIMIIGV